MAPGDVVPFTTTHYPPDANCSVADGMVNFLNLTGPNINRYLAAYCFDPPDDDSCLHGFCSNPDIAGPLVRIASELTQAFGDSGPGY